MKALCDGCFCRIKIDTKLKNKKHRKNFFRGGEGVRIFFSFDSYVAMISSRLWTAFVPLLSV